MSVHELEAAVTEHDGLAIVELVGDIDAAAEAALTRAYDEATDLRTSLLLDFSRTGYINSSGIAVIVTLLARARADGIEMSARGLSDHYREIFEITRLSDFIHIVDGRADD
jgi:anti-anti-sigma factor